MDVAGVGIGRKPDEAVPVGTIACLGGRMPVPVGRGRGIVNGGRMPVGRGRLMGGRMPVGTGMVGTGGGPVPMGGRTGLGMGGRLGIGRVGIGIGIVGFGIVGDGGVGTGGTGTGTDVAPWRAAWWLSGRAVARPAKSAAEMLNFMVVGWGLLLPDEYKIVNATGCLGQEDEVDNTLTL